MLIIGAGAVARAAEALATARGADVVLVTQRPAVVEQLAAAGVKARTLPAPDQLAAQVTQQLDGALPEVVFDTTGAWLPAAVRCVAPFGRVVVMIERRPYAELGGGHYGWLETRHHFSFAHYYAPSAWGGAACGSGTTTSSRRTAPSNGIRIVIWKSSPTCVRVPLPTRTAW